MTTLKHGLLKFSIFAIGAAGIAYTAYSALTDISMCENSLKKPFRNFDGVTTPEFATNLTIFDNLIPIDVSSIHFSTNQLLSLLGNATQALEYFPHLIGKVCFGSDLKSNIAYTIAATWLMYLTYKVIEVADTLKQTLSSDKTEGRELNERTPLKP